MSTKKGRVVENDNAEEKQYGPGWHDVYNIWKDMLIRWPDESLEMSLLTNTGIYGQAGLRYVISNHVGTILGAGCFLGRTPEDSKTAAGAAYRALTRAWYELERREAPEGQEYIEL
jgi:hypothetical protein